jgi:hypothetical protein
MLDTMVIAFPWALGWLIVWHRTWTGERPWPFPARLGLGLVTALAGWQALFLVGLGAVALAARRGRRLDALPDAVATVAGAALAVGWGVWVHGSLRILREKLARRSGGEGVSVGEMIAFATPWLGLLLGIGLLAWIACALSLREERFRPVAALALVSVVGYAVIVREGAAGHQYWNYWGLLPTAVGWAWVGQRLAGRLPVPALLAAAVVVGAVNLAQPDRAGELIDEGVAAYRVVDGATLAPGQATIPYVAEPFRMDDWLRYRRGPPGQPLTSRAELADLARDRPDTVVVVLGSCQHPDPTGICDELTFGAGADRPERVPTRLATAADLAAELAPD